MSTLSRSWVPWGECTEDGSLAQCSRACRVAFRTLKSAPLGVLLAIVAIGAADRTDLPNELQSFISHLDIAGHIPTIMSFSSPSRSFLFWVLPVNALFYGGLTFVGLTWRAYRAKPALDLPAPASLVSPPGALLPVTGVPTTPQVNAGAEQTSIDVSGKQTQPSTGPSGLSLFLGSVRTLNPETEGLLAEQLESRSAAIAWKQLRPDSIEPERVEFLKFKNAKKSSVYRLRGVGPAGTNVIAKRSRTHGARVERLIYENVLPLLSELPTLRYFGSGKDRSERYTWLFVEEAEGLPYSSLNQHHRELAGRWLAEMHSATLPSDIPESLPSREPAYYLQMLRECRRILMDHLVYNPILSGDAQAVFSRTAKRLYALESKWDRLEEFCEFMPRSVVHGDLVLKNVRVRDGDTGPELQVFDWEYAGWGVAAVDLSQFSPSGLKPDLKTYWSVLKRAYPHFRFDDVRKLAACGDAFRLVDELKWTMTMCDFASYDFVLRPAVTLQTYEDALQGTLYELEMMRA